MNEFPYLFKTYEPFISDYRISHAANLIFLKPDKIR